MKTCRVCKQEFTLDNFHKKSAAKDGFRSECKYCHRADSRKWIADNPERNRARASQWYHNNKEATAIRRATYFSEYRELHKDRDRARYKKWKQDNKELVNHYSQKRRATLVSNGQFYISKKELIKLYSNNCVYCGGIENITLDHVIPIARGGRHSIGNVVSACLSCNVRKQGRTITEWRKALINKPLVK